MEFTDFKFILNHLIDIQLDFTGVVGTIQCGNDKDEVLRILKCDFEDDTNIFQHGFVFSGNEEIDGSTLTLERKSIRNEFNLSFYYNTQQFLEHNVIQLTKESVYIYDCGEKVQEDIINDFNNYLKFLTIVNQIIDYDNNSDLIIIGEKMYNYHIPICNGLLLSDNEEINKLNRILRDDLDTKYIEELKLIIKNNLIKFANKSKIIELKEIIEKFKEFTNGVVIDYQIYINQFAFDKINTEFLKQSNHYTDLMNNHFDNVSKMIFSIPISVIFVFLLKVVDYENFEEGFIIFITFLFYTLISIIMIIHHMQSLKLTNKILNDDKKEIYRNQENSLSDIVLEHFKEIFEILNKRSTIIKVFSITIIISLIVITIMFFIMILRSKNMINDIGNVIYICR